MPTLDTANEYLVWFEPHRDRWVAIPIRRKDHRITKVAYDASVSIVVLVDRRR